MKVQIKKSYRSQRFYCNNIPIIFYIIPNYLYLFYLLIHFNLFILFETLNFSTVFN